MLQSCKLIQLLTFFILKYILITVIVNSIREGREQTKKLFHIQELNQNKNNVRIAVRKVSIFSILSDTYSCFTQELLIQLLTH